MKKIKKKGFMAPIILFTCRVCDAEVSVAPSVMDQAACPNCKTAAKMFIDASLAARQVVTTCASCGHDMFYVQKDFNRRLGVAVVASGVAVSIYFFAQGEALFAMAALGATALVDFFLYLLVGNVTVCYSCHAIYRGFRPNPEHEPFDLKKLEKYGGRDPRLSNPRP
jgi:hypothetical protein